MSFPLMFYSAYSIFRLPKDSDRRDLWLKAIAKGEGESQDKLITRLNSQSAVCSKHFSADMFFKFTSLSRLKKDATPVIFDAMSEVSRVHLMFTVREILKITNLIYIIFQASSSADSLYNKRKSDESVVSNTPKKYILLQKEEFDKLLHQRTVDNENMRTLEDKNRKLQQEVIFLNHIFRYHTEKKER